MSYLSIESSTRPITASNTDVAAISSSIAGVGTNIPLDDNRRLSGLNKANTVSNSGNNTNGIHEPKWNADTREAIVPPTDDMASQSQPSLVPFVELDAQRGGGSDTDLVGVPRMILNQILARLAQPEGRLEDEELPRYES
ncbi:hypothetical protein PHLCEN_2v221 [Hermanssonia centrifuga]|uniref:Uncharacterized protein n=1 Tax=Hermanssonia centrifuga TaxID=98765 RepID=A0A2R6S6W0_9APHY|nr:hypothetical protein PHLCEN_2v221 [Hermanssonia centrifuga]